MEYSRVFKMSFAGVYPHYLSKAEKKGKTKEEVDTIIFWLTGYDKKSGYAVIVIDPEFFRPSEVELLLGDFKVAGYGAKLTTPNPPK